VEFIPTAVVSQWKTLLGHSGNEYSLGVPDRERIISETRTLYFLGRDAMIDQQVSQQEALNATLRYPFFSALFNRRSRRISKGIKSIPAGSLSYTSDQQPQPLEPLEESPDCSYGNTPVRCLTPLYLGRGQAWLGSPMLGSWPHRQR
jgi:hypothetical protein